MNNGAGFSAELLAEVPQTLHEIVDNFWIDWCKSCAEKNISPDQKLPLATLGKTWACSDFIARNCIRYPDTFYDLLSEGFGATRPIENYRQLVMDVITASEDDDALMRLLRELRQREMLRIAWRDLNSFADTETILHELTDLAEAVVSEVLQHLERQQAEVFGMPVDADGEAMPLLTFAMGKMGGGELNFSSDIDLIFCFPEEGETLGPRKKSHSEFYVAVIRKLVKVLDEVTVDGFVYRVDTRLRPFGDSGPLAMSFSGIEQYYQLQGRDWERYAMIKARLVTGRDSDKKHLQSMLTPFVYRRYLDFSMLDSIREMKAMISAQMQRKGMKNNIKLGHGGIREIEFIGQTLQLIRAGREPELRQRSLIKVLKLLAEKDYLQLEEVERLIAAYWFLRKLENRLQMMADKQTHALPDDVLTQQRLCIAMDLASWENLLQQLATHQAAVDAVFQHLVTPNHSPDRDESNLTSPPFELSPFALFWADIEVSDEHRTGVIDYLSSIGYEQAEEILGLLTDLRASAQVKHLTVDTARLLARLMQSLISKIADYPDQVILLDRVCRIIRALAGRKVYISLLSEYPAVQLQMLTLCATSEWFTERLVKYPILLDGLMGTAEAFRRQYDIRKLLALELQRIVGDSAGDGVNTGGGHTVDLAGADQESADLTNADPEQLMERMRQFKRQTVFSIAMLDVFYEEPVERVSDRLTELADVLLEKILDFSWQAMAQKYGEPCCVVDGRSQRPSMSIVAYGKMGGNELGYDSDLDIIFLHNSSGEKQLTDGDKSIDNQQFFARVAQRIIHFLNTRTYSGILYEADTRLRPNGQSGLMVSSISAFESYQREKAWVWEHQALIRARFVTEKSSGAAQIEPEFDRIRGSVLRQPRDVEPLLQEVVKMREKMRQHLSSRSSVFDIKSFDIKQDAGGLVDIEFMTQAGVLIHAGNCADCIKHTATLELISELADIGWFEAEESEKIAAAYRYFRKLKNWQNLQCVADESEVSQHREAVVAVWQRLMPEKDSFK